jgi:hypothetical protein
MATETGFAYLDCQESKVKGKGKEIPVTGREDPWGCETSNLPHFLYTFGSQTAVSLSALRVGRPLTSRKLPGTHFC